jgi:hypothetical protein
VVTVVGPVDVFVDLTELGRVHDELKGLITRLDVLDPCSDGADPSALGGDDAADAVARFVGHWSSERKQLLRQLRDCARYVEDSMREYAATEDLLERACGPAVVRSEP